MGIDAIERQSVPVSQELLTIFGEIELTERIDVLLDLPWLAIIQHRHADGGATWHLDDGSETVELDVWGDLCSKPDSHAVVAIDEA